MKKVVANKTPVNEIEIENCTKDKFYGVTIDRHRTFIRREGNGIGTFYVVYPGAGFTDGEKFTGYQNYCITKTIEDIIVCGGSVFQFDSYKELMEWVAKAP